MILTDGWWRWRDDAFRRIWGGYLPRLGRVVKFMSNNNGLYCPTFYHSLRAHVGNFEEQAHTEFSLNNTHMMVCGCRYNNCLFRTQWGTQLGTEVLRPQTIIRSSLCFPPILRVLCLQHIRSVSLDSPRVCHGRGDQSFKGGWATAGFLKLRIDRWNDF